GLRQHLLAHAVDPPAQLVEAVRALLQRGQGQDAPAAADGVHNGPRRAVAREHVEHERVDGHETTITQRLHFPKVSAYDSEMTITVTGATGHLGQLILSELQGQDVRAVARRPEAISGVEARLGDYDRPSSD